MVTPFVKFKRRGLYLVTVVVNGVGIWALCHWLVVPTWGMVLFLLIASIPEFLSLGVVLKRVQLKRLQLVKIALLVSCVTVAAFLYVIFPGLSLFPIPGQSSFRLFGTAVLFAPWVAVRIDNLEKFLRLYLWPE